jgi:hypothetical protein
MLNSPYQRSRSSKKETSNATTPAQDVNTKARPLAFTVLLGLEFNIVLLKI